MRDIERVESAHRQLKPSSNSKSPNYSKGRPGGANTNAPAPQPMEIGNVQKRKLTPEERDKCMKEGLCLRCRARGHRAKECPKGRRN